MNYYNPAIYYDNHGTIREILLRSEFKDEILSALSNGILVDEQGNPASKKKLEHVRYGWGYLTGKFHFTGVDFFRMGSLLLDNRYGATLADGIDFRKDGFPSFVNFASGISGYEKWGRWTSADAFVLKFSCRLPARIRLKITASPYDDNFCKPVRVNVCGIEKEFIPDDRELKEYAMDFDLPPNISKPFLIIQPGHPHSPKSIGAGGDERLLGLSIEKIMFEER